MVQLICGVASSENKMATSAAALFQAKRAYYLAQYYLAIIPNVPPYVITADLTTLSNYLLTLQAQILAGTVSPDIANLQMQVYIHTYGSFSGYLIVPDVVVDLAQDTAINGGGTTLWNDTS